MKRLILAVSLMLIMVAYTVFSERYVAVFCEKIDIVLDECSLLIAQEKYSQAESSVSKLYDMWEDSDIMLSVILGDGTVTEPQKNIVSIKLSLADKNYGECLISIRECQGYIHEIAENNRISLGNIL